MRENNRINNAASVEDTEDDKMQIRPWTMMVLAGCDGE